MKSALRKDWIARLTMVVLAACCSFFALDVAFDLTDMREADTLSWVHLVVEFFATLSIVAALFLLRDYVRLSRADEASLQESLDQVRRGINQLILDRIQQLRLTQAEQEVALFIVKGYGLSEVASLRGTSEGTAKAQAHAVYQKAGVSSRSELILHCIDEIVGDEAVMEYRSVL